MMDKEQYLLAKLAEECGEVAQIALKTQQFGMEEVYNSLPTNRLRLHQELDDLMGVIKMLNEECGLGYEPSAAAIAAKEGKVSFYFNKSCDCGRSK